MKGLGFLTVQCDYDIYEDEYISKMRFYLDEELNVKYMLNDLFDWYGDTLMWWRCLAGHVFMREPKHFLDKEHKNKEGFHFMLRVEHLVCPFCAFKANNCKFDIIWDAKKSKNTSSNKSIVFSEMKISNGENPIWRCPNCKNEKPAFLGDPFINIGYSVFDRMRKSSSGHQFNLESDFGICNFCNKDEVIEGYNDICASYPLVEFRWDEIANNSKMNKIILNAEVASKEYSFMCKNGHKWESNLLEEDKNTWCSICDIPLPEEFYWAVTDMGLEKLFSEFRGDGWHDQLKFRSWHWPMFDRSQWVCSKDEKHIWSETLTQRIRNPHCPKCIRWVTEHEFRTLFNEKSNYNFVSEKIYAEWGVKNQIQIDIVDTDQKIAIDYDGYDAHSGNKRHKKTDADRRKRDTDASLTVLAEDYIMIRIRERDKTKGSLPNLDIEHKNFFHIEYDKSIHEKVSIVNEVLKKIEFILASRTP